MSLLNVSADLVLSNLGTRVMMTWAVDVYDGPLSHRALSSRGRKEEGPQF